MFLNLGSCNSGIRAMTVCSSNMNTNKKYIKGRGKRVDISVNETGRREGGDIKLHNMRNTF